MAMKLMPVFVPALALVLTSCGNRPAGQPSNLQPPKQAEQAPQTASGQGGSGQENTAANQIVRAPSPFGSREPATGHTTAPAEAVAIPRGAALRVRLEQGVDTSRNKAGDRFTATLDAPVLYGAHVAIPKGTLFTGHLTSAKPSGRLRGRASLGLTLDSFELNGKSYTIDTSSVSRASGSHKKRNVGLIGGGSGVGALIGAIAGGGKGALIGAGAGAAAGTAGAVITGRRHVRLPAETPLTFTLRDPVTL
jgi:hypothetical protein